MGKKVLASLMAMAVIGVALVAPVGALTCGDVEKNMSEGTRCAPTSILGQDYNVDGSVADEPNDNTVRCSCDNGTDSNEIIRILNLVVSIMTIGVGILGVLGISIVGIQYLTAGGNEEKTRKAKKRIIEIVIGLVIYALMYAILTWLLPGFGGQS